MNDPIETLSEIRSLMDRSSRFISLSGLSGVFAGIFALVGGFLILFLNKTGDIINFNPFEKETQMKGGTFPWFTIVMALIILMAAIISAILFTSRNTKTKGLKIWNNASKRFLMNLLFPLIVGGLFCLVLIYKGYYELAMPVTLLFYGMALLNSSKYTLDEIRYLAFIEIVLGLISSYFTSLGFLFWMLGFGAGHIIYGLKMYYKYEQ